MTDLSHREDVKALLRKRYGTVNRFEEAKGLPKNSVSDLLRGKKSARTEAAVEEELSTDVPPAPALGGMKSDKSDNSTASSPSRRLKQGRA